MTIIINRAVTDPAPWRDDASCAGMGASWDALTVYEQQTMCATCPVADTCLADAVASGCTDLVFGGVKFPPLGGRRAGFHGQAVAA